MLSVSPYTHSTADSGPVYTKKSLRIPRRPGKPAERYQQKRDSCGKQILLAEAQNGILLNIQVCTAITSAEHVICRGACKYFRVIYQRKRGLFVITVVLTLDEWVVRCVSV